MLIFLNIVIMYKLFKSYAKFDFAISILGLICGFTIFGLAKYYGNGTLVSIGLSFGGLMGPVYILENKYR